MLKDLGDALRESRKARRTSLDNVATAAQISAPYLLKLERGEVGSPSPRVLARVAVVLELPYLRLMELAGYLDLSSVSIGRSVRASAPWGRTRGSTSPVRCNRAWTGWS